LNAKIKAFKTDTDIGDDKDGIKDQKWLKKLIKTTEIKDGMKRKRELDELLDKVIGEEKDKEEQITKPKIKSDEHAAKDAAKTAKLSKKVDAITSGARSTLREIQS